MSGHYGQDRWNVFTYGSLMISFVFQHVTGRCPRSVEATLHHWKRFRVENESFPAIVPAHDSAVKGIVWIGLTPEELARLDEFEGDLYDRVKVEVSDATGLPYSAEVYRWSKPDGLIDAPWDLDWFKTVGIKDFSSKYL